MAYETGRHFPIHQVQGSATSARWKETTWRGVGTDMGSWGTKATRKEQEAGLAEDPCVSHAVQGHLALRG